jgi:hypothetical protein
MMFENCWEVLLFFTEHYFDAGYGTVQYMNYKDYRA